MNIEKKYQLRIPTSGIVAFSDNLDSLKKLAASADMDCEGILGWDILDTGTGEVMAYQKDGLDCTIADLEAKEKFSVRLYNGLLRKLIVITGNSLEEVLKKTTMRDIRRVMWDGQLADIRNCGYKAKTELYALMLEYCGSTKRTHMAINQDISVMRRDWHRRNPEKPWPSEMLYSLWYEPEIWKLPTR